VVNAQNAFFEKCTHEIFFGLGPGQESRGH